MSLRTGRAPLLLLIRVWLWRGRHVLAVVGLLLAATALADRLAPAPAPTASVVVTARDVPAGHELAAADVRVVALPARLAPDGVAGEPAEVTGRRTVVSLPAGLPVVGALLSGARFDVEPPPGAVVVPVTLTAAAATGLLRPGDLVDLVAPVSGGGWHPVGEAGPDDDGPPVLARGALVLEVAGSAGDDGPVGSGLVPSSSADAPVVAVVAVSAAEGRLLAGAAWGPLGAVLVG